MNVRDILATNIVLTNSVTLYKVNIYQIIYPERNSNGTRVDMKHDIILLRSFGCYDIIELNNCILSSCV